MQILVIVRTALSAIDYAGILTNVPLLSSLKTSENLLFSDAFRGFRSVALVENGLICCECIARLSKYIAIAQRIPNLKNGGRQYRGMGHYETGVRKPLPIIYLFKINDRNAISIVDFEANVSWEECIFGNS